ncbi:MAG: GTPase HflX [Ruminococcus sp.]|nr:GTPase HflX [Ruminococcus sp.]
MENTLEIKPTRALLVSVDTGDFDAQSSLLELFELAKSAGADPLLSIEQKLSHLEPGTCVGSGKLLEIKEACELHKIELIIFDLELSPVQIRNIETATDVRTIDRTMLILDIFAQRAKSKEGKLQVELAQLKYMLPRLTGKGVEMSRLGGGIGTRGPGETKLETDKRHIRRRMETLKEGLKEVIQHREQLRRRRKKDNVITVAIVGYTNAGKSTLMNFLTEAGVLAQDKLFATLDPTSRALKLPNGVSVMMIDTVGLVRRLPHHLVEAFKSTLEEAALADIILNVCDASSDEALLHLDVTEKLLVSLGCVDTPIVPVLNKCDLVSDDVDIMRIKDAVKISAKHGEGIEKLLSAIEDNLPLRVKKVKLLFPFDKAGLAASLRKTSTVNSEEYTENGVEVEAVIDEATFGRLREYVIE